MSLVACTFSFRSRTEVLMSRHLNTRLLFLFVALWGLLLARGTLRADEGPLRRIAFGSCAKESKPQPIWEAILTGKPELFLFLGDNIYGDTNDMNVLKAKYAKLAVNPGYQRLKKSCRILATWDDHDYGANDAGAEYPHKRASQQLFLDFFSVPADSPRRQREGVYDAQIFGPPGQRVQVILLDTRYFRSPMQKAAPSPPRGVGPYVPSTDRTSTLLGETQWKWLEEQLKHSAQVRIIASSIQVISDEHGWEKWMNFPHERERLFRLLRDTKAGGVIFLSGDRHLADLSVMDGGVGYPLFDVTASGLTEAAPKHRLPEPNSKRIGGMPWGNHFGVIAIDWYQPDPVISMQIRDEAGEIRVQHKVPLSLLQVAGTMAQATPSAGSLGVPRSAAVPPRLKPSPGAVSPVEAAAMVGQEVTLEFQVQSTGGVGSRTFLNSAADHRDNANFTVVLEKSALEELAKDPVVGSAKEYFQGKAIRVKGKVEEYRSRPQIKVTKANQVQILGK